MDSNEHSGRPASPPPGPTRTRSVGEVAVTAAGRSDGTGTGTDTGISGTREAAVGKRSRSSSVESRISPKQQPGAAVLAAAGGLLDRHRTVSDPGADKHKKEEKEKEKKRKEMEKMRKKKERETQKKEKEKKDKPNEKKTTEKKKGIHRQHSVSTRESASEIAANSKSSSKGTSCRTSGRNHTNADERPKRPLSPKIEKEVRQFVRFLSSEKSAKKAAELQSKACMLSDKEIARMGLLTRRSKFKQKFLVQLLQLVQRIVLEEPIVEEMSGDVIVVSDIHGQLEDLLRIFKNFGTPKEQYYVFLGDYVDRGPFGVECFMLLVAYKLLHPFKMVLLRGNHENEEQNRKCGFLDECVNKYDRELYLKFRDVFYSLPVCAIVNERAFCCHGGIGPDLDLAEVSAIQRPVNAMEEMRLNDLMWADPDESIADWRRNDARGTSYYFGLNQLLEFFSTFKCPMEMIVRGHEPCRWGFEFLWSHKLVTIFTASNYMTECNNYGTVLFVPEDLDQNILVHFVLAPGQPEPADVPVEGGGRTRGSSIAGTPAFYDDDDEIEVAAAAEHEYNDSPRSSVPWSNAPPPALPRSAPAGPPPGRYEIPSSQPDRYHRVRMASPNELSMQQSAQNLFQSPSQYQMQPQPAAGAIVRTLPATGPAIMSMPGAGPGPNQSFRQTQLQTTPEAISAYQNPMAMGRIANAPTQQQRVDNQIRSQQMFAGLPPALSGQQQQRVSMSSTMQYVTVGNRQLRPDPGVVQTAGPPQIPLPSHLLPAGLAAFTGGVPPLTAPPSTAIQTAAYTKRDGSNANAPANPAKAASPTAGRHII